ncbi:hypothetical protein [Xanthobacter sp. ZOL 2024]
MKAVNAHPRLGAEEFCVPVPDMLADRLRGSVEFSQREPNGIAGSLIRKPLPSLIAPVWPVAGELHEANILAVSLDVEVNPAPARVFSDHTFPSILVPGQNSIPPVVHS